MHSAERADAAGRRRRQIEDTGAQRPAARIPFGGSAVAVAPAIAGVIEVPALIAVQLRKSVFGLLAYLFKPADRQHQPIRAERARELARAILLTSASLAIRVGSCIGVQK